MKRLLPLLVLFLTLIPPVWGQEAVDSIRLDVPDEVDPSPSGFSYEKKPFGTRILKATYLGVPLMAVGVIEKGQDHKFLRLREDFLPVFRSTIDDGLPAVPAAAMLGLKAMGVPSRSGWGRMLASGGTALTLNLVSVELLKKNIRVMRPDGSNIHSFPSGHTTMAFMTATMLSKEYGYLSPWVSLGGYGVATATGLMRIANNRHWLSDVFAGAGLGILSAELGYLIMDEIFKDKNFDRGPAEEEPLTEITNPSFISYYVGFNITIGGNYDLGDGLTFKSSNGSAMGVEGAYYFNHHLGFGGKATLTNLRFIVNEVEAQKRTFNTVTFYVGPYFSLPFSPRWSVSSKLLAGWNIYPRTHIEGYDVVVPGRKGWGFGTGFSVDFRAKRNLGISAFLDYNIQPPRTSQGHEYMNFLAAGIRAGLRF